MKNSLLLIFILFFAFNCSEKNNITDTDDNYSPVILPSGKQLIVFSKILKIESEIFVMDIEGDSSYQLTNDSHNDFYPSFSPDGEKISYISNIDETYQVRIMNTDGSKNIKLFDIEQPSEEIPQFVADQSKVYYYDFTQLHISDIDGQNYFSHTIDIDYASWFDYVHHFNGITSTKDGQKLLFAARLNNAPNYSIVTFDVNSNYFETILDDCGPDSEVLPVYSNDESKISFKLENDLGYYDIFLVNNDGDNLINLTKGRIPSCYAPFFSPDDQYVLFTAKPSGSQTIFAVDTNGDSIVQISSGNESAGGGNVVFTAEGNNSLYYILYNKINRYDLSNYISENIFIGDNSLDDLVLSGSYLYFIKYPTLMRINLDGSNLKQLSNPEEYSSGFQIQPIVN